ncbi:MULTISPECIES: acyltransferase domain-containing protein [Streptomyces]|uniref:acyltransferase domain-containing protein n=1 Tax=Streptomyces TaxID=1883 RepID=UPI0007C6EECF|nr:acyltransferase domain-containing protein [Streptomyces durhamensis]
MPLTADSAVIRRLMVRPGPAGEDRAPVPASAAAVSAVLRAFGRSPRDLPVRTVVYVGAHAPDPALAPEHEGFAVRTASAPGRALRLAHQELHDGTADFALVAGFDEPEAGTITVYAVKRAAEAVADGDAVLGVLGLATADPDAAPELTPLIHGHRATDPGRHRLLLWSGRDEQDEQRVRGELLPLLSGLHHEAFPALPTVVPCGTEPGPVRGAAVTVAALAAAAVHKAQAVTAKRPRPVALLFPGQGSQHHAMAAGLYGREPVFTAAFDAALAHMGAEGPRIRADWLTDGRPLIPVDDVRRAQPLLFAVDYALGRMVIGWGVRPTAVLGHSAGELVAATIAGAVALPDAVAMVMERVREAVKIPPGGMLAVAAEEHRLRPYLRDDVAIAAVNANQQTMLAGSAEPLAEIAQALRADGLTVVTVPATSPFHSPAMAPASRAVEEAYRNIPLRPPTLPLYSGYTGELLRPEEAVSPRFWARQITDTVYFKQALESLLAADDMLLIEAGPRQTLTAFARRHRAVRLGASAAVPLLPGRPGTAEADRQSVLTAAARLWTEGHTPSPVALSALWTWGAGPRTAHETTAATPRLAVVTS